MERLPRVLVIDDDLHVLRAMELFLQKYCTVTTASSGPEGIEAVKQRDYDIALVDIRMPVMSGLETLRRLKELKPDIEVLIITGGDYQTQSVKEAIKLGAADCLRKPIRYEILKHQIMETMRHRKAASLRRSY